MFGDLYSIVEKQTQLSNYFWFLPEFESFSRFVTHKKHVKSLFEDTGEFGFDFVLSFGRAFVAGS